jgi:flagellar hook-length control protein FliK
VQSAQLKLDGLGADKVEVNISMNGNEAQVDFRTDQAETRHMLEGAVSQLKDMLSLEGVVLSGVSVGTSSSQQGEQQRQARQQATLRQGKAEVLVPVADVATVKTSRGAGRALDLFV